MLFTYVFLLGFFISTAVCEDESTPQVGEPTENEEEQPEVGEESVQETTTTTASPSGRSKPSAGPPQSPQLSAAPTKTTKSKGSGVKGFAKKFAGAVTKGSKKAFKATKTAANTVKNKVVRKK